MNFIKAHVNHFILVSYIVLILTQMLDTFSSELTLATQWVVLAVRVIPLFCFATIVYRSNHPKSLIWFCFLLIGYFVGAILGAFSPRANIWDFFAIVATVVLFLVTMMQARWIAIASNASKQKDTE